MGEIEGIDQNNIPQHVAIIMDGNGRWAREKGQERIFGHFNGVESVRSALKGARKLGVNYLTLYAFSTENWNRPQEEVAALMDLLVQTIVDEVSELDQNDVRLRAIGALDSLPPKAKLQLEAAMERTASNKGIQLVLALSYSARWEIVEAVRSIVASGVKANEIDEELITKHLTTQDIPDPELMIRTSGEQRISNFLLWQIAYAELYFTPKFWPDFRESDLYDAIKAYQQRQRRFGKTAEQITLTNEEK
ncbi:isoprenyl transferase [Sanyastnella coralliicola]|uniref:isoprenyl transferase n=1 Tax=Sanyastnella coralliicola TaxID=3069118 RepID=UPI0027B97B54|nr:isoprenyl transferase [Longitalea sp. SCSIO 12813]